MHIVAFSAPSILTLGILFASEPRNLITIDNDSILHDRRNEVHVKRNVQETLYLMIEISKAVIQVILLFIVSRLSTREDKKDALHVVGKYDSVVNGIYNDMIRKETVATKHES